MTAHSTTERFVPMTDWFPSTGVDILMIHLILRNKSGNFGVRPAVEWAAVRTDEPSGTYTPIGVVRSADDDYLNAITFTDAQKGPNFYMRIGILYASTSGSAETYGEVTLVPTMYHCGRVVGAREVVVNPGLGDTTAVAWFDWVAMESGYDTPGTGNSRRNTDQLAFPAGADVTNNVYGQLGIGIVLSSAAQIRAIFRVASAVTYS